MKNTLLLGVLAVLAACKSVPVAYETTFPEIGTTATAGVGEHLITQGYGVNLDAIVVPFDQKIGDITVRKGKYPSSGKNKEYVGFGRVVLNDPQTGTDRLANLYLFDKDKGSKTVCVSRKLCGDLEYSMGRETSYGEASSQKTLIYSGKIGDKITLGYREFSGNMARPAFSNDVAYDLSASPILGYKGARLEVISATNTEITYKVIADFK